MNQHVSAPVCGESHADKNHEANILAQLPDEGETAHAAAVFSQLADATRVRLLCMLAKDELCVCEMSDLLGMSQPAVSHHLRGLREFGAIDFRKNGQRTLYSISESDEGKAVRQLLNVIGCGEVSHA